MNKYFGRRNVIIIDIDGVIANNEHRLHHIIKKNQKEKDYPSFFKEMDQDTPNQEIISLIHTLNQTNDIIIVTGRPDNYKTITEEWLKKYDVPHMALFMRPEKEYKPETELKKGFVELIKDCHGIPLMALDDNPAVIEMYETEGINSFKPKP